MFRIDLETGKILTLSGKKSTKKIHFIEAQTQTLELEFVKDGQIFAIPENAVLTIAGDVCEDRNHPMFIADGKVSADRKSVTFEINTCTEEYFQRIHSSNTVCLVDVNIQLPGESRSSRLTRFIALADARIYVDGITPQPLNEYYTKEQIDQLLAAGGSTTAVPGYRYLTLDHIYFHQSYGAVGYLDSNNNLTSLEFVAEPVSNIQLFICSDSTAAGNIVLACGNNRVTVPVTTTPQRFDWQLQEPLQGIIDISRQYTEADDTLKDSSGSVVSALVIDWRVY